MSGGARLGDKAQIPADAHGCPACPHPGVGPAIMGSPDVNTNKLPALRKGDPGMHAACCNTNTWKTNQGSATVFINGKAAVRMGDETKHMVLESEIIWVVEDTFHHLPKKWKSIMMGVLLTAGAVVGDIKTDGKAHVVTLDLLADLIHVPNNDTEAEKVGELIGNLFGALFFNSAMFDKGGLFHDFREKHTILGGALWGNVKASPIEAAISLLLKRYVVLYDRIKTDLKGLTRDAGEQAFVNAMHTMEDQALKADGFEQLKGFRTDDEDEKVSLQNIALTILRIRHVVKSDFSNWIQTRYGNDIEMYKNDVLELSKLGNDVTGYNAAHIVNDNMPRVYHLMAATFTQALDEIINALKAMFEPFSKSDLSWVTFLKALGVAVGDTKKIQKELMDLAKNELAELKQLAK